MFLLHRARSRLFFVQGHDIWLFVLKKKYSIEIVEKAHMVSCNPSRTPVDTESKLGVDGDPVCLHMHDPREPHLSALKRILRYVQGTLNYGLQLFSSSTTDVFAYSDADWAGCPTTRRSTSGYCVFLGNNLLSWSAKHLPTLSRSSTEAEYHGVANVVTETYWLRNLLGFVNMNALFIYMNVVFRDLKCPFLGWVDSLMCPRLVEIIHGLLNRHTGLEEVVDLFEEHRSKYKKYHDLGFVWVYFGEAIADSVCLVKQLFVMVVMGFDQ
nr:ribonuclease H-like domain-containing protein [Tanacetum cinerariifolium]